MTDIATSSQNGERWGRQSTAEKTEQIKNSFEGCRFVLCPGSCLPGRQFAGR